MLLVRLIGSSDGLACYQNGAVAKYTMQDGLANNTVLSIDQDRENIWVGTTDGLSQFNGGRFLTYTTPSLGICAHSVDLRAVVRRRAAILLEDNL
jgi:ligand-binding sensor domain-containing protein